MIGTFAVPLPRADLGGRPAVIKARSVASGGLWPVDNGATSGPVTFRRRRLFLARAELCG
jgi:hypothetical protein